MSKRPIKTPTRSITPVLPLTPLPSRDVTEVVETRDPRGFVSFQYSYTEVSSHAGRTHVRSNKTLFADGKLTREAFEGELEGDAYRQMVDERSDKWCARCRRGSYPGYLVRDQIGTESN